MRYKVLKEFLTVKNPRWLKPGEIIDGQPTGARIKALLERGYIEEVPERQKTVDDLEDGDECYIISGSTIAHVAPHAEKTTFNSYLKPWAEMGEIYLTREDGEKTIAKQRAEVILRRDTKGFKPDWTRNSTKWDVSYDHLLKNLVPSCVHVFQSQQIYFATYEDAESSIKAHPKEWKYYLGVEE